MPSPPNNSLSMTEDTKPQVNYSVIQKSSCDVGSKQFYTAEAHLYALFVHGITVIAFVIWVIVHAQLASCMPNHPICTCCLNCHLNYDILQLCACKYEQKKTHLINKALCSGFQSFLISQRRPFLLTLETGDVFCIQY